MLFDDISGRLWGLSGKSVHHHHISFRENIYSEKVKKLAHLLGRQAFDEAASLQKRL